MYLKPKLTHLKALRQEMAYATYLNLSTIILPPPRTRAFVADYARALNACLATTSPYLQISIRIPLYDPNIFRSTSDASFVHVEGDLPPRPKSRGPLGDLSATWEAWDVIRTICNYNARLSLSMLDMLCALCSLILF